MHLALLYVEKVAVKQPRTHDMANLTHERMKEKGGGGAERERSKKATKKI